MKKRTSSKTSAPQSKRSKKPAGKRPRSIDGKPGASVERPVDRTWGGEPLANTALPFVNTVPWSIGANSDFWLSANSDTFVVKNEVDSGIQTFTEEKPDSPKEVPDDDPVWTDRLYVGLIGVMIGLILGYPLWMMYSR